MLDIETTPFEITNEDVKTYLMDKKISKEQRCFDPKYSKVILICVKPINQEVKVFHNEDEKQLLTEFWDYMKNNFTNTTLVTHNGYKFDIPFLILRSCIHNVKITKTINTNRWQLEKSNHFDTMLFFSQNEIFTNINIDILGKMHGINVPEERFFGSEIEKLYKEGHIDKIKEKCKQDVEILEEIFKKLCQNHLNKIDNKVYKPK